MAGTLKVWNLVQLENTRDIYLEEAYTLPAGGWIQHVASLDDNKHIISVSLKGELKIWDIAERVLVAVFTADESLTCLSVIHGGHTFITGGAMGRLHLLRLQGKLEC